MQHTVIIDLPKKPPHVLLARLAGKSQEDFLEFLRQEVLKAREEAKYKENKEG